MRIIKDFVLSIRAHNLEVLMILKRKIYKKLLEWKNETQGKKALMVEGADVTIGKSSCKVFGSRWEI